MFEEYSKRPVTGNFDPTFPLRTKFIENYERAGVNQVEDGLTGLISGEIELIARTSYRLGHSEQAVVTNAERAYELTRKLHDTEKLLAQAQDEARLYRNRAEVNAQEREAMRAQLIETHDKFVKLDKKAHPAKYKKATAKKVSKK